MLKSNIGIVFSELFQVSLVTYLILLIMESLDKGFISNVINLNIPLGIVLISGIIKILPITEKKIRSQWDIIDLKFYDLRSQLRISKTYSENDFYFVLLIAFGGGLLILYKTYELGTISFFITGLSIIIIILLSYLIFSDMDVGEK